METKQRKKKLFVFLNPYAGKKKKVKQFAWKIVSWAESNAWDVEIYLTREGEDLRKVLENKQRNEIDVIGAAGGDGTVSEVISAIAGMELPLLILPSGSANIFAKNFYIPSDVIKCLNLLNEGSEVGNVDLMEVDGKYRMLNAGAGFNARLMIVTTRKEKRKFGIMAYFKNIWKSVRKTKQVDFKLTIDGEQELITGADVFVPNAGFGMHSWIEETFLNPNDGIISVFVTRPSDIQSLVGILGKAVQGKERKVDVIKRFEFQHELKVECDVALPAQSDGEWIGTTPLTIKIVNAGLKLIIPSSDNRLNGFETIKDYFADILALNPFNDQVNEFPESGNERILPASHSHKSSTIIKPET